MAKPSGRAYIDFYCYLCYNICILDNYVIETLFEISICSEVIGFLAR